MGYMINGGVFTIHVAILNHKITKRNVCIGTTCTLSSIKHIVKGIVH